MFQATRRRLALWYTIVTAILLLLFATGVYFYVRSTLIERIDDTLKHVVEVVERSLVIESSSDQIPYRVNIEASFRNNQSTVEDDHIDLEWFSSTGNLLWSTLSEPLDFPLHPDRIGETVRVNRQASESLQNIDIRSDRPNPNLQSPILSYQLRQVTERVQVGRYVLGYLRVSHPWFEVTKPIRQLLIDLALGTTIMAIAVGAIGWFLSGLAIAPVRESYHRLKQFTADASHELRNPIATIQANVQMALSYPDWEPQQQRQQLYAVERLTQRLGRFVNDLLFLARADSGMTNVEWQTVPLDALLMEVVEEQQIVANKKGVTLVLKISETPTSDWTPSSKGDWLRYAKGDRLSLSLADFGLKSPLETEPDRDSHYQDEPFTIQGDWDQLARLFTNLVSNAVQYRCLESDFRKPLVEVELQLHPRSPHSIQVKVKDNGVGIAESALPYIFERFYRVDPARTSGGTGLGLAIAAAIVENHQGQIQVESVLNQGTTFTVTLPASKVNS